MGRLHCPPLLPLFDFLLSCETCQLVKSNTWVFDNCFYFGQFGSNLRGNFQHGGFSDGMKFLPGKTGIWNDFR